MTLSGNKAELPGREHLLQFAEHFISKWEDILSNQLQHKIQFINCYNVYDWGGVGTSLLRTTQDGFCFVFLT